MNPTTIALIGNPNCGKSTLFNLITGAHQRVGNYPGITVEKHEGTLHLDGATYTLVDLPGAYSLTAYSVEELAARDFLLNERPLQVIVVVDAVNVERSLALVLQIQEMGMPVMLTLNMMDELRAKGMSIDQDALSAALGAPVVGIVARTGEGKEAFLQTLKAALADTQAKVRAGQPIEPRRLSYGTDLDPVLERMEALIAHDPFWAQHKDYPPRWVGVKYLEQDEQVMGLGAASPQCHAALVGMTRELAAHTNVTLHADPDALVADYRYGAINSMLRGVVQRPEYTRFDLTDKLDRVLTNALIGPLLMLAVLYSLFWLTIELGATPQGWVEDFFAWLTEVAKNAMEESDLRSLLVDGIIAGVGGVLGFAPLILIMYFFLSFLEDSGYLARMAYMLDRVFRMFGLHGASVVPFIISGGIPGGCAVPGVMAARTLRSPKERIATVLTAPFLSCGAKTPVFLMLSLAFFNKNADMALFGITLAGWAFVLLVSLLLRKTVIAGASTPFVMELPPYRLPTLQGLVLHTWERVWMYVKKAGTVILAISVIIWAAMTYPRLPQATLEAQEQAVAQLEAQYAATVETLKAASYPSEEAAQKALAQAREAQEEARGDLENAHAQAALAHSVAGRLGRALETVSAPAGFDWRTNIALIGGFAAKEVIVSTLGTAYSMGEVDPDEEASDGTGLAARLAADPHWNRGAALAFMLFVLLYAPCFVTVAVIGREIGWKWAAFSVGFNTLLAYCVAVLVNTLGAALV